MTLRPDIFGKALDELPTLVSAVANEEATVEGIAAVMGRVEALKRYAAEMDRALKDAMVEHIVATGQDLVIGEIRYYAGTKRETVGNETMEAETLMALFDAAGGDLEPVAGCLRSQPFRVSACKALLPEEHYTRLFSVVEKVELREGVARKQLCSVNTTFSKQKTKA